MKEWDISRSGEGRVGNPQVQRKPRRQTANASAVAGVLTPNRRLFIIQYIEFDTGHHLVPDCRFLPDIFYLPLSTYHFHFLDHHFGSCLPLSVYHFHFLDHHFGSRSPLSITTLHFTHFSTYHFFSLDHHFRSPLSFPALFLSTTFLFARSPL